MRAAAHRPGRVARRALIRSWRWSGIRRGEAQMGHERIRIATRDGVASAWVFRPAGQTMRSGVRFFMDGLGPRAALFSMAQRLADGGYAVVLPDLYYRDASYAPFDPATVFSNPSEMTRLRSMAQALTNDALSRDIPAYADALAELSAVAP